MLGEIPYVNGGPGLLLTTNRFAQSNGVMMRWLAIPILAAAAIGQGPGSLAGMLIAGREVASFSGGSKHVAVAPDGSAVATVDHKRMVAVILDPAKGTVKESSHQGSVSSIALLANGPLLHASLTKRESVPTTSICSASVSPWKIGSASERRLASSETGKSLPSHPR